jgi:nucleotide-binding universal stress UspA family protein
MDSTTIEGKCLLVPVDFQDASNSALHFALDLAQRSRARVVLCHVCRVPLLLYPSVEGLTTPVRTRAEVLEGARSSLERTAAEAGGLAWVMREGDPAARILALIDELRPTMVVMGTHGRGALARLVLGSVAATVVRRSPVPVFTVHAPLSPPARAA